MHSRRSFWPTLIPVILLVASCASVGQETTRRVASDVTEGTLYNFQFGSDGARPYAGMVFDASGNLYGTTQFGGISHSYGGTVFKLSPDGNGGWTERVLHTFQGYFDGQQPVSAVAVDSHGNVFGTTPVGGIYNFGTVYQLIPRQGGYQFETIYTFTGGSDGGAAYCAPIVDAGGNVYGTTNRGGANSYGTLFKLTRSSNHTFTYNVLHDFGGPGDGLTPTGLTFDPRGNIFGTTAQGGVYYNGVVFELARGQGGTWTESVLYSFTGTTDGGYPEEGPVFDSHGNLWGTTAVGGDLTTCGSIYGCGTVFELKRSGATWTETVIHSFQEGTDGAYPISTIAFDSLGNIYGTTTAGGNSNCSYGCGTVFQLTQSAGVWTYSQVYAFQGKTGDGANPVGGLAVDAESNFYGTTNSDGAYGYGTVFEMPAIVE